MIQVKRLVEKLLEYLQAQLAAYEEEEQEIMQNYGEQKSDTICKYVSKS